MAIKGPDGSWGVGNHSSWLYEPICGFTQKVAKRIAAVENSGVHLPWEADHPGGRDMQSLLEKEGLLASRK